MSSKITKHDINLSAEDIGARPNTWLPTAAEIGALSTTAAAASANKLNTDAGDSNTPIYFSNGVPTKCTGLDLDTTGNAETATKLKTARTITFSGDVSGSTSFDGSGDKTITIAVADNSHNHSASNITAGTFAGQIVANSSYQTPGTSLLRNSKLVSSETAPSNNGEICWLYE